MWTYAEHLEASVGVNHIHKVGRLGTGLLNILIILTIFSILIIFIVLTIITTFIIIIFNILLIIITRISSISIMEYTFQCLNCSSCVKLQSSNIRHQSTPQQHQQYLKISLWRSGIGGKNLFFTQYGPAGSRPDHINISDNININIRPDNISGVQAWQYQYQVWQYHNTTISQAWQY